MREQLALLLDVQAIDTELMGLVARGKSLPIRTAEIQREKVGAAERVAEVERHLEELNLKKARLELDLNDWNAKLAGLESKRNVIKTNEEFRALMSEIELTQREISTTEDAILGLMEETERLADELPGLRRSTAEAGAKLDEMIRALEGEQGRLSDSISIKRDERKRAAMRVDQATLVRYERILSSKRDFAVAFVVDGVCSGCYKRLPPQTVIEIRRAERLVECDGCGRILSWRRQRYSEQEGGAIPQVDS